MKIQPRPLPQRPRTSPLQRLFSAARAPRSGAPSAELSTVPPERQAKVLVGVKARLSAQLAGKVPGERQAAVAALLEHLGASDFYERLAQRDPQHARDWQEMARVQRKFASSEAGEDPKTRAYSESMRLTLHASVLQHFALPETNKGESLFHRFIALHVTAFHENGGWIDNLQIPLSGALAVAEATPAEMWLHAEGLLEGSFIRDAPTVQAAQWVRQARREAIASGIGR